MSKKYDPCADGSFPVIGGPFDGGYFWKRPLPTDGDAWNHKGHIYRFDAPKQAWVFVAHVLTGASDV